MLLTNELRDWIWGKGFQIVEIRSNEHQITLVNLHLLSRAYEHPDPIFWEARTRQLKYILDRVRRISSGLVILGGDFNFEKHSLPYDELVKNNSFENRLETVVGDTLSSDNSNREYFGFQKINQRIDHFFIRGLENQGISGDIIFKEPSLSSGIMINISDHYGLSLIIQ